MVDSGSNFVASIPLQLGGKMNIHFPRSLTEGILSSPNVEIDLQDASELPEALKKVNPRLYSTLYLPTGELRPFVRLFVNGDEAEFIHSMAGG